MMDRRMFLSGLGKGSLVAAAAAPVLIAAPKLIEPHQWNRIKPYAKKPSSELPWTIQEQTNYVANCLAFEVRELISDFRGFQEISRETFIGDVIVLDGRERMLSRWYNRAYKHDSYERMPGNVVARAYLNVIVQELADCIRFAGSKVYTGRLPLPQGVEAANAVSLGLSIRGVGIYQIQSDSYWTRFDIRFGVEAESEPPGYPYYYGAGSEILFVSPRHEPIDEWRKELAERLA